MLMVKIWLLTFFALGVSLTILLYFDEYWSDILNVDILLIFDQKVSESWNNILGHDALNLVNSLVITVSSTRQNHHHMLKKTSPA